MIAANADLANARMKLGEQDTNTGVTRRDFLNGLANNIPAGNQLVLREFNVGGLALKFVQAS